MGHDWDVLTEDTSINKEGTDPTDFQQVVMQVPGCGSFDECDVNNWLDVDR